MAHLPFANTQADMKRQKSHKIIRTNILITLELLLKEIYFYDATIFNYFRKIKFIY